MVVHPCTPKTKAKVNTGHTSYFLLSLSPSTEIFHNIYLPFSPFLKRLLPPNMSHKYQQKVCKSQETYNNKAMRGFFKLWFIHKHQLVCAMQSGKHQKKIKTFFFVFSYSTQIHPSISSLPKQQFYELAPTLARTRGNAIPGQIKMYTCFNSVRRITFQHQYILFEVPKNIQDQNLHHLVLISVYK